MREENKLTLRLLEVAGGGFDEGRRSSPLDFGNDNAGSPNINGNGVDIDMVVGTSGRMRDSLSSYLLPYSQHSQQQHQQTYPLTPPQSVSFDRHMPNPISFQAPPPSIPLTPVSSSSPNRTSSSSSHDRPDRPSIPLISAVFPSDASQLWSMAHLLEIVTPPDHILQGFILDHPTCGRTVFVHLPPPHSSTHGRAEVLQPHFSEVLRPHDPLHHRQILSQSPTGQPASLALDIKESLTALLDLSSDSLDAKNLMLVLDRDDRDHERLEDLLHSLMYAGGQVIPPGRLEGGYEWDARSWVLVGIEL